MQRERFPVLLTGATGFVGRHVYERLAREAPVICTSRDPERAARRWGDRTWRRLDVSRRSTIEEALTGCRSAVYLVHGMTDDPDYAETERRHARAFADVAEHMGIERLVYLGGIEPSGPPSPHLRSRLAVGEVLRSSEVSTVELRASMIIGAGSQSWQIVRDLARRLPAMVLPRWLESRTQPVGIDDVSFAIVRAIDLPDALDGIWDIPGPETLTGREILTRVAHLCGTEPLIVKVPFVTPRLSSHWIRLFTSADIHIARELVEGLRYDLVSRNRSLWDLTPEHRLLSFDEAAERAFAEERAQSMPAQLLERIAHGLSRKAPTPA